jgi:crotonobetainyl-CoA:carnitine CoA-transferase CaiB-like acyl-CoA transferase
MTSPLALSGTLVLDASRMLPGAVLVRTLLDLGARVIKIEDPSGGDYMRSTPPLVDGVGAGFHAFFAGAESVTLDLRSAQGASALRTLARHADLLLESFRPGTLEKWGLGLGTLRDRHPMLVTCSLPGFPASGTWRDRVGHDLNVAAVTGLLERLPEGIVPGIQVADVGTGLQAGTAVLGALLLRVRTGRGSHVEQPLVTGPLPFLTWAMADARAGGGGVLDDVLVGRSPCYRVYPCAGGTALAAGTLEPKFWAGFVGALDLRHLSGDGLDTGRPGEAAIAEVEKKLRTRPASHWADLGAKLGLPLSEVLPVAEAVKQEWIPAGGRSLRAPSLGNATARVLAEFGAAGDGTR